MAATSTVLCIHRDPAQLAILREKGYGLVTATNGSEGLRLLLSRPVDAVVLEYSLRALDGAEVADEIRRVRPQIPIVNGSRPAGITPRSFEVGGCRGGRIRRSALSVGCDPFFADYQGRSRFSSVLTIHPFQLDRFLKCHAGSV